MKFSTSLKTILCTGFFALFSASNAKTINAEEFASCVVPQQTASSSKTLNSLQKLITDKPVKDAIYLEADSGSIKKQGISTLNGDIIIQQNTTVFNADQAQLNRDNEQINARGNVVLTDTNYELKSPDIEYNLKSKTGTIKDATYSVGDSGLRGKSTEIKKIDDKRLQLQDATFTSCPANMDSWHLASSDIILNNETQIGNAKNVTFNVGKVPVFYFPWLRFPMNDQRLSGFLTPSVKLQSNEGISLPYYLNLAPNYDATFRLTTINNTGVQIDNEFRYLTQKSKGTLEYDFIPEDQSYEDQMRYYFKVDHQTKFNKQTRLNLKAEGVSDADFFDDFSSSLETSTRPALQRRLEFVTKDTPWNASIAVEDYQVLDSDDDPYSKLPELKLGYAPKSGPNELKVGLDSELVYFDKADETNGARADIKFTASKKWGDDAWYFKPKLSLEHTIYSLDISTSDEDTYTDSSIDRTLPTVTLDAGLFFDRQLKNNKYTQTLEPRLFYTYTPYKDQSDIPIFDTALTNFSESNQLFLENRFTGKDRIADNNKLTFAVTSRIQNRELGRELFKTSIGQVFNFTDRKVTLPGGTISTGTRSDLVLELSGRLNDNFRLSTTASVNNEDSSDSSYYLRLNYQDDKKRIANISLRKLDTELKQLSFSGALPINDKWSMVASTDQDLKNNRNLESLVGIEYQDCCWKTRLVVKRYLTSDNITYDNPVYLEFELKGLGNIGRSATSQIKENIYGYDDY
ncbi:LPS-assembly protein LptD [Cocleimonas flava]|uniref:LPS-assembly protein LptD n=1 Tax=Cocleimonas flava TaxID=634765 RepID=A0A4R1F1X4_9GAMM|nr:LPS assembly protein LptD [Cocleimonas flava]TCJ87370.1 LPS-assembly protein [Cocleimonas flava]